MIRLVYLTRFCTPVLLAIVLLIASCSKDNDPKPADLIIGNWTITSANLSIKVGTLSLVEYFKSQGLTDAEAQLYASQITDSFKGDIVSGSLEFKKGGSYSSMSNGTTSTGTWELSSDGKTLTLDKGTVDGVVFTVNTLTASDLNIVADQTETDSGVSATIHLEVALKK